VPNYVKEVTIANGQTISGIVDLGYGSDFILHFPTMTGTTMTFQACDTKEGTFRQLQDGSGAVSVVIASNLAVAPTGDDKDAFRGVRYIKLVSGSAEGAERNIKVLLTPRFAG
jgi:hypothetical protein